ncbi:hypothetical protein BP6252_12775 [Coleophoma cylindrospora]|uniref:Uncharacterized protein n=1 Tax=Coleophoma cylindrospora TaxID=1849047 RepID=A0A3D8QDJ5_9HELO|nr:hypothetical protein BP6252_12775 [Coleophoma cylindrospora]
MNKQITRSHAPSGSRPAVLMKTFIEENCKRYATTLSPSSSSAKNLTQPEPRLEALDAEIARFNAELALTATPQPKRATDPRTDPRDEEWALFMRLHGRKVFLEGIIRKYAGYLLMLDPEDSSAYAFIQGRMASLTLQLLHVKGRIDDFEFS